ncbi:hypothetical protein C8035_v004182 [Colletotrichum spinosum]|uniref:Uncharacterized protein n=2 Tax=Colletotrichum orbiculare species complex TaxID=2707354 RepID=A0A4R8QV63_COLTR|nr:hypothetical protein C8035_v004182 [Colletotrichum spinosum]TDZ47384.1 hypothetical protein CTRI78_v008596 [Colletotrichum trifolii]
MRLTETILIVTAVLGLAVASPQRGGSKAQQKADRQALKDLAGTDVDPNLENGTSLLSNGQGQCVAVSGKAVCSDSSGATFSVR